MELLSDKFEFHVKWEPFLLRPSTPTEGIPQTKYGDDNPRVSQLREAGKSVGIDFKWRGGKRPNTLKCHALMRYAKDIDDGKHLKDLAEFVYKAHFIDGIFLDTQALVNIAGRVGLNKKEAKKYINDEQCLDNTREISKNWAREGVAGVPCVYMNGERVFRCAQEIDIYTSMILKMAEKHPVDSLSQ